MDDNVPPVYRTPPPLISPPRSPRGSKNRGWLWLIVALVCAFVMVLIVAGSLTQTLSGLHFRPKTGRHSGRSLEEITMENNGSRNKIVIVGLEGLITGDAWNPSGTS